MNAQTHSSLPNIISQAFKTEGVGWMLRGWTPAWIRLGPNSLIIFMILEQLRNAVDSAREKGIRI